MAWIQSSSPGGAIVTSPDFSPRVLPDTPMPGYGEPMHDTATLNERIWLAVAAIPPGRVSTYGHVAAAAGLPRGARRVGRALGALPAGSAIPWHRVINARGELSLSGRAGQEQRRRLLAEDVQVTDDGRIVRAAWRTTLYTFDD